MPHSMLVMGLLKVFLLQARVFGVELKVLLRSQLMEPKKMDLEDFLKVLGKEQLVWLVKLSVEWLILLEKLQKELIISLKRHK